ncbi:MAG: GGDEF domain-containing phosphodiesterase [Anaerovorax sp.]|nr:GGDEF domain-containing phosphodiesterase [Anaerovorax sp.]
MLKNYINSRERIAKIFFIMLLILFTDETVYLTGGTQSAFTHFMYIPILMAAFWGDVKFASITAVFAGISLGPFMYQNVMNEVVQEPKEWIFRLIIFTVIGIIMSFLFERIKQYKTQEIDKAFFNEKIGLVNANKLKIDLAKRIRRKESFSLVAFQIANMDHINRSIDYKIGEASLKKAIYMFSDSSVSYDLYYIYNNEFAVVLPKYNVEDTYIKALRFLEQFREPVSIEGFKIEMVMKAGIVHCPSHSSNADELFKKMELALDQASDSLDLCVYDAETEKRNKEKYELQVSLHDAISNKQLHLVYQPKISLKENKVIGVEALLRWKHPQKGFISPEQFITIAENIGIINDITKWVIENTILQLSQWQQKGFYINAAINFSSKDVKTDELVEFIKECIKDNKVNPEMIELEITERGVIKNLDYVKSLLNDARKFGFKISIDDFGTGYNSLFNLIKLPVDHLKIDKFFIDQIKDLDNQIAVKNIINMAHKLDIKVIAEGVENQKQLEWLKQHECDYVQGYYYSKPLLPDELIKYVRTF